jgi:hypothetical protein
MRKMLLGLGVIATVTLVGCSEGDIIYQEKEIPVHQAEELIADQLEVENPDRDIEVNIYEEADD